ncbi:FecR family protein [Methylobacter sp.]|uniref:FecR family protein n=1 Tax=Methylobacter sp. TaxID=2051955 RepID=UPI002FDEBE7A
MTRAAQPVTNDPIVEQAADWIVRLTADDPGERILAQAGYDAWKQADPRHAEAALRIEHVVQRMHAVRSDGVTQPARSALHAAFCGKARRTGVRRTATALVLAGVFALPVWLTVQAYPPAYLLADIRTATGEWNSRMLADGTQITLSTRSAVNLSFDEKSRTIELVSGEILVDVAPDSARPFIVETAHARIRALGTRFAVSRETGFTVLTMLESKVAIKAAQQADINVADGRVIIAGQRVRISADSIGPVEGIDVRSVQESWNFHQLVVADRPLPDVLDELSRHRPGRIQYRREKLADIKVSAVLPLNDTDKALQLLAASFPGLRIRTMTPYLVMVDVPASW